MNYEEISDERRAEIIAGFRSVPFARHLGIEIMDVRHGEATLKLRVRDELRQPYGMLHGGATASLIDTATAIALIGTYGHEEKATTIDLNVHYLRPVVHGEIFCTAKVVRAGRRILFLSAEVVDEHHRIVATALSTYARIDG